MAELIQNRTYTSKTFDNGDGTKTLKAHAGHIHYKGTDNSWKEVDFTLEDMGSYWQMVKASYKLLIAKDFGANELIRFQNKYRGANHQITYEPKMLAWVNNPDMSDMQVFRNQQSVIGYITGDTNNVVRYDNAFGDGIHFEITLMRSGFKKEVVIEAKNKLELPPTANHKLVALFKYDGQGLKVKSNDKLREWNKVDFFEETAGFRIQEEANEVYQSFIRPAYIIDDGSEDKNQENIKVFWKLHNGSLWQAKVLPKQFLLNATYPVRADTTTSYYAGAGDGYTRYSTAATWDIARDGDPGNNSSNTELLAQGRYGSGTYHIARAHLPFDLSALGTIEVSSATIYLYCTLGLIGDGGSYPNTSIMACGDIATTTITTDDYAKISATAYSSSVANTAITDNQYNTWSINATGLTAIETASGGWFKAMLRDGSDIADSAPGNNNMVSAKTSEETGTSQDPYLEVTYTVTSTDYPITASVGSFTLTGIASTLRKGSSFACAVGEFTLSGIATTLTRGLKMIASAGSFALTGIDILFNKGFLIACTLGEFTLTGIANAMSVGRYLAGAVGSFTLTGIDIAFSVTRKIIATVGAFVLSGISVILRIPGRWTNVDKNSSEWTNNDKNSSSWSNQSKN